MTLLCCVVADPHAPVSAGVLESLARSCSPRVEPHGDTAVVFDASGLTRVLGPPADIAREVTRLAAAQGIVVRVALAGTSTTAWVLAHARAGQTIVEPGQEAVALAQIPLGWVATLPESSANDPEAAAGPLVTGPRRRRRAQHYRMAPAPGSSGTPDASAAAARSARPAPNPWSRDRLELLATLERWGLRTLGDLAALPHADVQARLGLLGARWHRAACGEDAVPLVPAGEAVRFVERLELEYAIEGLEPLAFVLSRLCDQLSATLERADRGAAEVTLRLRLVTRAVHERVLHLPAPMRDPRVLRTLLLLDAESHPPAAAIDVVEIELAVVPGRIVQGSLLTRSLPSPEDVTTLVARLGALVGETRVGAPVIVDSYDERAVAMKAFAATACTPRDADSRDRPVRVSLRRFRLPIAARVTLERGTPVHVEPSARGIAASRVLASAGPSRSSGHWWSRDRSAWDRDDWDVELGDGVYRLAKNRATGGWEIEGILD